MGGDSAHDPEQAFAGVLLSCYPRLFSPTSSERVAKGAKLSDTVAVDAKRILLRYGAPISVLDKITEADRIDFARTITRTALPEREARLRELLAEHGYVKKG
jgi:hypothetical protein